MQQFTVNCHSSVILDGTIFIDPYNIPVEYTQKGNYIFITHTHHDHLDEKSLDLLANLKTVFICTADAVKRINEKFPPNKVLKVEPNGKYSIGALDFTTFPAYNVCKPFHPKEQGWVGYSITYNNKTYAILGDTDACPHLAQIKCDYLFIPVGGTYTMDYAQAADLTNQIRPTYAIPTHYGSIVGNNDCGAKFSALVSPPTTAIDVLSL